MLEKLTQAVEETCGFAVEWRSRKNAWVPSPTFIYGLFLITGHTRAGEEANINIETNVVLHTAPNFYLIWIIIYYINILQGNTLITNRFITRVLLLRYWSEWFLKRIRMLSIQLSVFHSYFIDGNWTNINFWVCYKPYVC